MPQLDPSSFPSQLFWLTVSFVVLYVVLARFLLPRVQSSLAFRQWTLESDVNRASRMKDEAEQARENYENVLADARAKSQALLTRAQSTMQERAAKKQAELDATMTKKLAEADASIRTAKQNVLNKLSPVSGELAALIVEVLVHYKPGADEVSAVINNIAKGRA